MKYMPHPFKVYRKVLRLTKLTTTCERSILGVLVSYAGPDGRGARPSAKTVADLTGTSERQVFRVYKKLSDVEEVVHESGGGRTANKFDARIIRQAVSELLGENRAMTPSQGCSDSQSGVLCPPVMGALTPSHTSDPSSDPNKDTYSPASPIPSVSSRRDVNSFSTAADSGEEKEAIRRGPSRRRVRAPLAELPEFPIAKLAEMWNQIPGITRFDATMLTPKWRDLILKRMHEQSNSLWWQKLITTRIAPSDWLCGRIDKGFSLTLPLLVGKFWDDVVSGKYSGQTVPQKKHFPL